MNGPLEGGKGIVTGAGSLVKNTVSGTFNSIGKVTGSLATGISSLAMVSCGGGREIYRCKMRCIFEKVKFLNKEEKIIIINLFNKNAN